jgi:SPP1 gp7 family putative phage head morphogenesis protein
MSAFSARAQARIQSWMAEGSVLDRVPALRADLYELAQRTEKSARAVGAAVTRLGRVDVARMLRLKPIRGSHEDETAFLDRWSEHQVGLLRNVVDRQLKAITDPMENDPLGKLWIVRNHAQLVAHNETFALSDDVIGFWSAQAGEDEYIWLTRGDDRVRPGHAVLDGTVQRSDSPPFTGSREGNNHPGHAPGCRCQRMPHRALEVGRPLR